MGYKTYIICEIDGEVNEVEAKEVDKIENQFFVITVNENGTLNIYDKATHKLYEEVLMLEDGADDGDEYDFSPLEDDLILYSDKVKADYKIIDRELSSDIVITYPMAIPKDLESRKNKVIDTIMDVKLVVKIDNCKPFIDVKFEINNPAGDHRVRTLIPTDINSNFSLSDNQFGSIKRDVYDDAMLVWQEEKWNERPDAIYPMLTYVTLSNEERGMAVLTNSTREFEIIGLGEGIAAKQNAGEKLECYDTIAITLFRSIGFLGKEEMFRRPGRPSGIKLPTPDSQMYGKVNIDIALYPYKGEALKANVSRIAKEYLTPLYTYNKMPHNAMKLNPVDFTMPYSFSLLSEVNKDITLSTIKKSEKNNGIIVRYYNGTESDKKASFVINQDLKVKKAALAKLDEKITSELNNLSNIDVKKNKVSNIYLEF